MSFAYRHSKPARENPSVMPPAPQNRSTEVQFLDALWIVGSSLTEQLFVRSLGRIFAPTPSVLFRRYFEGVIILPEFGMAIHRSCHSHNANMKQFIIRRQN